MKNKLIDFISRKPQRRMQHVVIEIEFSFLLASHPQILKIL
jgi:hypothetical protein